MGGRAFSTTVWREGDGFVAQCRELDVASQGLTADEARDNLREAVELFLETASEDEVVDRLRRHRA